MMRRDRRRQSTSLQSPISIFGSTLAAWYDFKRGVTLGTPPEVAAWADQSGKLNDASQATVSRRPLLASDGLNFDGIDDNIFAPSSATLDASTALTVAIRVNPDDVSAPRCPIARATTSAGSWATQANLAAMRFAFNLGSGTFGEAASQLTVGVESTFVWVYAGGGATNADRLQLFRNGALQSQTYTGTIPSTITNTADTLSIGCFSSASGQHWDGRIKAAVVAIATASSAQRASLEAYMRSL
jgi:hypothetical protein